MRVAAPRFAERGVGLACIVQARAEDLLAVCGSGLTCIPDPEHVSHRALGLGRISWWKMLTSCELRRRWFAALRAGHAQDWRRTFARESDKRLLPAAALVERGGRILWLHRGEHTGDLPSADALLAIASEFAVPVRS